MIDVHNIIHDLRTDLERRKGKHESVLQRFSDLELQKSKLEKKIKALESARLVIQQVATETQSKVAFRITEPVDNALKNVFPFPYKLKLQFNTTKNRTEVEVLFERDGLDLDPTTSSGVGQVDIASFALRCVFMVLGKSVPVLILDEPFKHVKGEEANRRALEMLKQFSDSLGIQIIVVSDERISNDEIRNYADKMYRYELVKNKTVVKEV